MITGARRLFLQHLSIRVPRHDGDWGDIVCRTPGSNIACRALPRIVQRSRDRGRGRYAPWVSMWSSSTCRTIL